MSHLGTLLLLFTAFGIVLSERPRGRHASESLQREGRPHQDRLTIESLQPGGFKNIHTGSATTGELLANYLANYKHKQLPGGYHDVGRPLMHSLAELSHNSSQKTRPTVTGNGQIHVTFVVPTVAGSGSRVWIEANSDMAAGGVDGGVEQPALEGTCVTAQVTAAVFVGNAASPFPVRWYGSSSTEYNVCGHGNLAAGMTLMQGGQVQSGTPGHIVGACAFLGFQVTPTMVSQQDNGNNVGDVEMQMGQLAVFGLGAHNPDYMLGNPTASEQLALKMGLPPGEGGHIQRIFLASSLAVPEGAIIFQVDSPATLAKFRAQAGPSGDPTVGVTAEEVAATIASFPDGPWPKYEGQVQGYRGFLPFFLNGDYFSYRGFYPQLKVPEDVATGSANALITTAIHAAYKKNSLRSNQLCGGNKPSGEMSSRVAGGFVYVTGRVEVSCPGYPVEYETPGGAGATATKIHCKAPL